MRNNHRNIISIVRLVMFVLTALSTRFGFRALSLARYRKFSVVVFVCTTVLTAGVYGETIKTFDVALNTIVAGIEQGVPLPEDILELTDGTRFPVIIEISPDCISRVWMDQLKDHGVIIHEGYIWQSGSESLVPAMATVDGLRYLAEQQDVIRVSSGIPMKSVATLNVSCPEILADKVWYMYDQSYKYIRGAGIRISVADTGVDVFHPSLFQTVPNTRYTWVDDGSGNLDNNGNDWVDLNGDSIMQPNEVLRFFDGLITDTQGNVSNNNSFYDVDVDWLYNDTNNNSVRDYGSGFPESQPSLGEMLFIADDLDGDNVLDTNESLIALGASKIMYTYNGDTRTRTRGVDLMLSDQDAYGHGTEVCGIIAGGWPGFNRFTGVAPDAELMMYNRWTSGGVSSFLGWSQNYNAWIMLWELGAWIGLYMDGTDVMDQMVDAGHASGIVQVVCAGNLAGNSRHASGMVGVGSPAEYVFVWVPSGVNIRQVYITMLWSCAKPVTPPTFDICDYNQRWYLNMPGDNTWYRIGTGGTLQFNSKRPGPSSRGTDMFDVQIQSTTPGGLIPSGWIQININSAPGNPSFMLHAYVADDIVSWGGGVAIGSYGNIQVTDAGTITSPATADNAITVASYGTRTDGYPGTGSTTIGAESWFSGRGPRITGECITDVAAPGDYDVYSPASVAEPGVMFIGEYREFGGTSGAGPHVVGAAALYMQSDPATYLGNPANVKSRIQSDAIADGFTGSVPNDTWGYGKLRVAITSNIVGPNFIDPNLKAVVESALGVTNPTLNDMLNLTTLNATNCGITNLRGLECATNLVELHLGINQISDLSPLSGLTQLTTLHLYGNQISDLSPLSSLLNLTTLRLDVNQISDISALFGLTSLTSLQLSGNQISDLSPLSNLTNLTTLYLALSQIRDISALSSLTQLNELLLYANRITDLAALLNFRQLTLLNVQNNPLSTTAINQQIPQIITNNPNATVLY